MTRVLRLLILLLSLSLVYSTDLVDKFTVDEENWEWERLEDFSSLNTNLVYQTVALHGKSDGWVASVGVKGPVPTMLTYPKTERHDSSWGWIKTDEVTFVWLFKNRSNELLLDTRTCQCLVMTGPLDSKGNIAISQEVANRTVHRVASHHFPVIANSNKDLMKEPGLFVDWGASKPNENEHTIPRAYILVAKNALMVAIHPEFARIEEELHYASFDALANYVSNVVDKIKRDMEFEYGTSTFIEWSVVGPSNETRTTRLVDDEFNPT